MTVFRDGVEFNTFVLPHTFMRQDPDLVIAELQTAGLTGFNLAFNYHSSRDFLIRQGPQMEYLSEGFHYYLPNFDLYPKGALVPSRNCFYKDNKLLESITSASQQANFKMNAWCVFLHNFAIGSKNKSATITNIYGNHFLSELCPSNPSVRKYVLGLTRDICSRNIKTLLIESVRFHGLNHGEHHERFFLNMSEITEFLLYLCFCKSCTNNFENGDAEKLKTQVKNYLDKFLRGSDVLLNKELSIQSLEEILGLEISAYLKSRDKTVTSLYSEIKEIAKEYGVQIQFLDPSIAFDVDSSNPLENAWRSGHDALAISEIIDIFEPIFFDVGAPRINELVSYFRRSLSGRLGAAVSPLYPYVLNQSDFRDKVHALLDCEVRQLDFYLLDVMRRRDLQWISDSILTY